MTHTAYTQSNMSVSSTVVNLLLSSVSKCAGEYFAAQASAKQKSVHCTTMIARKLNDKDADMDYLAVLPPDYNAGGDSNREELCQQAPWQFTLTATGAPGDWKRFGAASSSERPETIGDPLNSGEGNFFLRQATMENNTSGKSMIHQTKSVSLG